MIIINYLTMRFFNIKIIVTFFEIFYYRKFILFHLRIINFIVYVLKYIQKKIINKSEKCILLNYENEFIFRFYNLIKKKIIRVNDIHFVKKRSHFVNFEKKIEIHKFSNKC